MQRPTLAALEGLLLRFQFRTARFLEDYSGRAAAMVVLTVYWPCAALRLAPLRTLVRLIAIAKGRRAWVGPLPRKPEELDLRRESDRRVAAAVPGLISPWWVRLRTNIAYGDQLSSDLEWIDRRSSRSTIGLLVRALLVSCYGAPSAEAPRTANICGLPIDNLSMTEALASILGERADARPKQVSFINVDCVNRACTDEHYRDILVTSDLRLGDGIGLRIAGRLLGSEIRENVNGTDLFPRLCAQLAARGESLFLLGGRPGVAQAAAEWAASRHPGLRIAGTRHGYFAEAETPAVIEEINASGAAVLLVAFGAPRQEKWIRSHLQELRVNAALGVGGLFDFYSGRIPRAPQWLREVGLEWSYRLYQEPGRMWRRYLVGNLVFLWRVLRERHGRRTPRPHSESEVISL